MPPPDIFTQALDVGLAIEALESLGREPGQTRDSAIRELEASGLSVQPGTVLRSLLDRTFPPETIGPVIHEGDRIAVGPDQEPYTVTSVRPGVRLVLPDFSQIEMRLAATMTDPPRSHHTPGGRSIQFETTHRVRMTPTGRRRDGRSTSMPSWERSGRPAPMDQHMTGSCTMHAGLRDTKKKSVWEWIRDPAHYT